MTQNLIDKRMSISSNSNVDRNLCSQSDICAQI